MISMWYFAPWVKNSIANSATTSFFMNFKRLFKDFSVGRIAYLFYSRIHYATRMFFLLLIGVYRTLFVGWFGGGCRMQPSCSEYSVEALKTLPLFRALCLILLRLGSCHPFGKSGWDPVPGGSVADIELSSRKVCEMSEVHPGAS